MKGWNVNSALFCASKFVANILLLIIERLNLQQILLITINRFLILAQT